MKTTITQLSLALFATAGFLALLAVLIIVQGVKGLVTASANTGSSSVLVLAAFLLVAAITFGAIGFWLRGQAHRVEKMPDETALTQAVRDLRTGKTDLRTIQQTLMDRAGQAAGAPGVTETANDLNGTTVSEDHANAGSQSRQSRTVTRVHIHAPTGLTPEARARFEQLMEQKLDSDASPSDRVDAELAELLEPGAKPVADKPPASPPPTIPVNVFVGDALTAKIAQANRFKLEALEINRAGHLSPMQTLGILGSLGLDLVFVVALVGFLFSLMVAFPQMQNATHIEGVISLLVPCGAALVLGVTALLLYAGMQKIGAQLYIRKPWTFFLVVADALIGRVDCLEGTTSRWMNVQEGTVKDSTEPSGYRTVTRYEYAYCVDNASLNVTEDGYRAFPKHEIPCRLYYLSNSKTLVNLETRN